MTFISLEPAGTNCRLDFAAGALIPRVIEQSGSRARVALVAGGALLLGGDVVELVVRVGQGCTLALEDIGATVAYNADGEQSTWTVDVEVESGGTFLWNSLPLVVADGANVWRKMRIALALDARICLRETIVLGRVGEIGGCLRQRMDITVDTLPVFVEELHIGSGVDLPGLIGANRVLDSVMMVGSRGLTPVPLFPVLEFEYPGTLARYLGMSMHASPLDRVWKYWSESIAKGHLEDPRGAGDGNRTRAVSLGS